MPMGGGGAGAGYVSRLIVDTDLDMGAYKVIAAEVDVDHVAEKTAAHGVVVDHQVKPAAGINATGAISASGVVSGTQFSGLLAQGTPAAGATVLYQRPGSATLSTQTTYQLELGQPDFVCRIAGVYRFAITIYANSAGNHAYAYWYKNGAATGSQHDHTGTTPTEYTDDLTLVVGDRLHCLIKCSGSTPAIYYGTHKIMADKAYLGAFSVAPCEVVQTT